VTQPEVSRRWVLQLGAGGVLTGFRGAAGAEAPLPPGVYLPDTNHLAHVIKAASTTRPPAGYKPQFFTPSELQTVREIVAALLGDVPPDVAADIANWIDLTVLDSAAVRAAARALSPGQRTLTVLIYGLEAVKKLESFEPDRICRAGLAAMRSSTARQIVETPQESQDVRAFVDYLRTMAIDGYYTSKEGLKELDYRGNSFYSESPGCAH
jgi:hypothetical protein